LPEASHEGRHAWPPTKEDLERLYLDQKLSAGKIATAYGLKYKNAKVAESTVLYQLKKNGIRRRDRADHVRKVTEAIVDEWVGRYRAGESLKQIAGEGFSPVTIFLHLRKRGLQLRDKVEAQIQAVTKYERKPFEADELERAYLIGLRYGDLHVVRHGRAIRVRVSTTHLAMAELFEAVFSPYGHVFRYPRRAKLVPYEWTLECDLSDSFESLLEKPSISVVESWNDKLFMAFLAGLFDAEGSILMHKKGNRHSPEISISNSDVGLIEFLFRRLRQMGFSAHANWNRQKVDRMGIRGESTTGRVTIWKFNEVQEFLREIRLRHPEKVAKAVLARELVFGSSKEDQFEILERWRALKASIRSDRDRFLLQAAKLISARKDSRLPPSDDERTSNGSIFPR